MATFTHYCRLRQGASGYFSGISPRATPLAGRRWLMHFYFGRRRLGSRMRDISRHYLMRSGRQAGRD